MKKEKKPMGRPKKSAEEKQHQVSITLRQERINQLDTLAERRDTSRSGIIDVLIAREVAAVKELYGERYFTKK